MDLTLNSEQEELLASIVDCVENELPVSRLHADETARQAAEIGRLRTIAELGWLAVGLPEEQGGVGLGLAEEALLFRELGRRLAPIAAFTSVLSMRVADGTGELATDILSGARTVAFAVPSEPVKRSPELSGNVTLFASAPTDVALLVLPDRALLLDVSSNQSTAEPCFDRTLVMTRAELNGCVILAEAAGDALWNRGLVLLAATMTGQAEATRDMINEYAKIRQTFGRPIGANQAVRHPIADMAVRCEQSKSLLFYAALAIDEGRTDAGTLAAAARAVAQNASTRNDDSNIQLHGGIGVTDDLDAHLYLKRTVVYSTWFGGVKAQLRTLLDAPLMEV